MQFQLVKSMWKCQFIISSHLKRNSRKESWIEILYGSPPQRLDIGGKYVQRKCGGWKGNRVRSYTPTLTNESGVTPRGVKCSITDAHYFFNSNIFSDPLSLTFGGSHSQTFLPLEQNSFFEFRESYIRHCNEITFAPSQYFISVYSFMFWAYESREASAW